MRRKLIIDGNAVYEIDDGCEVRRREGDAGNKTQKSEESKSRSSSVNISLGNTRNPENNHKNIQ